jgi:hypothetical protein
MGNGDAEPFAKRFILNPASAGEGSGVTNSEFGQAVLS